jgi:hypothetical protein
MPRPWHSRQRRPLRAMPARQRGWQPEPWQMVIMLRQWPGWTGLHRCSAVTPGRLLIGPAFRSIRCTSCKPGTRQP